VVGIGEGGSEVARVGGRRWWERAAEGVRRGWHTEQAALGEIVRAGEGVSGRTRGEGGVWWVVGGARSERSWEEGEGGVVG